MAAHKIFIIGTGTSVGKTVFTGLLLGYLRAGGIYAKALKPFCSGNRSDLRFFGQFQPEITNLKRVNPWFFRPPVAPAAARERKPGIRAFCDYINDQASDCQILLVEGIGGVYVPIVETLTYMDYLVAAKPDHIVLVGSNALGTLNHTLLSLDALKAKNLRPSLLVLMDSYEKDSSTETNAKILRKFTAAPIFLLPFLTENPFKNGISEQDQKFFKKTIARTKNSDTFFSVVSNDSERLKKTN